MSGNGTTIVVTGASRGLGRGIARAFGAKGATVYMTGRALEGALSEAAAEVDAAGGRGVAVACDHRDDAQVKALFERIANEAEGLDILVNNAAAVYAQDLIAPGGFWEKPLRLADMLDVGMRSNYVAAYYAAPLMIAAGKGLIANISFYGAVSYFHGPAYGGAKAGTDKMTRDMAIDLAPHGVSAVSIWPGFILTDEVAAMPPEFIPEELRLTMPQWERPEFTGLVIEALSRSSDLPALSGQALIGAELGERLGVRDIDGKQPISYRAGMGAPAEGFTPAQS